MPFELQRNYPQKNVNPARGFTLIELVIVIVILGVLAVVAAPRFLDLGTDARRAVLINIAAQVESMTDLVKAKARVEGLRPLAENPSALQSELIVDFGFGQVEVMFSNLCPEAQGELGDSLVLSDFLELNLSGGITTQPFPDNRYYRIGYDIPGSGTPTDQGCYLFYDSFAVPDCTVTVVDVDC